MASTAVGTAPEGLALPTFKGRPGWEFTDISALDLAAYERVLPVPVTLSSPAPGVAPLWEIEPATLPPASCPRA